MSRAQEIADLLAGVTITTADNNAQLTLVSTDADGSTGPVLKLHRNTASPADTDLIGQILFHGEDDGSNDQQYVSIQTVARDITAGTEDGQIDIATLVAGTSRSRMVCNEVETVFNQDSVDVDFRVESNGNANMLFVDAGNDVVTFGKTDAGSDVVGCTLRATGQASFTMDGNGPLILNRKSSDGDIALLQKDNSTVGSIGTSSGYLYVGSTVGNDAFLLYGDNVVRPATSAGANRDDAIDLGHSSARFDDIFATNGTIQTSDENEKQDIASLTSAEITAAKAISALFKTFKWKDKVESKGDAARTHTGVIAQEVQTAMSNAGLDAADYAFWCSDTWTDDDGNSQTRMGIRYPELLAFVGAATEQRLADIEARITAIEAS